MILAPDTKFDINTHKNNFINYLEVIILKDGTIKYAVPSHEQFLIQLYIDTYNVTREELITLIPIEEIPIRWLIKRLGVISVWYKSIVRPSVITKEQETILKTFVDNEIIYDKYKEIIVKK